MPLEDPAEGLEKGKLLFELRGYKLHGKWTLVKIKKGERDWLLIKERDAWVVGPSERAAEESVLSGLTVEEVKAGQDPARPSARELERAWARPRRPVDARRPSKLMLAEPAERAFTRDGWLFELKLDGYRLLAARHGGEALLLTRNGNDYTAVFPEIARAVARAARSTGCSSTARWWCSTTRGRPSFSRLQQRGRLRRPLDIRRAAVEMPVTYYAFDLLGLRGLRPPRRCRSRAQGGARTSAAAGRRAPLPRPRRARRARRSTARRSGSASRASSRRGPIAPYKAGRSAAGSRSGRGATGDFVIVGFTPPKGAAADSGRCSSASTWTATLVYAGRVGTGSARSSSPR